MPVDFLLFVPEAGKKVISTLQKNMIELKACDMCAYVGEDPLYDNLKLGREAFYITYLTEDGFVFGAITFDRDSIGSMVNPVVLPLLYPDVTSGDITGDIGVIKPKGDPNA